MFDCTPTTVRRIWKRASVDLSGNKTISHSVGQQMMGKSGRKQLYIDLPQRIQTIPHVIAKYSSVVKPSLADFNKVCCLNWVLDQVRDINGEKFIDTMYDTVHVDEKWFFMTRLQRKVIGAPGEKIKQRTCKFKRHLLKVMFLSAVARPRCDDTKQE
ncbi:hypothetical protein DYB28_003072 [Aphanomyces astaci]|uniref:Uncharacterized protein n=2 Tax=Aphanomyces astaci TaxID=112090 RepID=A0A397F7W8_APHAT|nr:hypothetical protein DYB25_011902 [Aphanomyces astaci]RHY20757.1 hypothetical protein DYB36_011160 [Aphanomyces astaci]RHY50936.1 hypothetical protein DYB34_007262 [Aphanomyces astaci]RHY58804.1 hypothetical protein DYB38_012499 [Aphanomyces astaci]RHY85552.1 hypothetical protein DYB26_008121 [Aphanomyces astaci]